MSCTSGIKQFGSALSNCLLFLVLSTSCNNRPENKYLIPTIKAADEYVLKVDSMQIPISNNFSHVYFTYTTYALEGKDYFIGYNARNPSIDIFNLTDRKPLHQIDLTRDSLFNGLDKQDQHKGKSVTDICVISFDSILVNLSNKYLLVIDTTLRKKYSVNLKEIAVFSNLNGYPISYSNYLKMLVYDDRILLNQTYYDENWKKKREIGVVSFDLQSSKLAPLPIYYSDYFYDIEGNAGFLGTINTSEYQKDSLLTYNYLYESNIYQYNKKDSTIKCFGAAMSSGKNLVTPFLMKDKDDLKQWEIHNIENSNFFNVMYDKFRKVYYRFSLRNIQYENGKYFNSILEKPIVLMIFNEDFEVIKEMEMPPYVYSANTWFVTKEGLFISPNNLKSDHIDPNVCQFHILKLSKK
jgi:hypothetical protein